MAWLHTLFERVKAPFPKSRAEERQRAAAVDAFAKAASMPLSKDEEQPWLAAILGGIRNVQKCQAQGLWLQAVQDNAFPLELLDTHLRNARLGLVVETDWGSGTFTAKMNNVRITWIQFVAHALAEHAWSIAHWPQRTHWFRAILGQTWPENEPADTRLLDYVQALARQETWARDLLLEYRVLHLKASDTLDAMFEGEFGDSLPFITAVAGIALRMHCKAPTVAAARLHRQAMAAWPQEMANLEASLHVQAMLENKTVAEHAGLVYAMETSTQGHSAYLPFYGESIHALARDGLAMSTPALELPALD